MPYDVTAGWYPDTKINAPWEEYLDGNRDLVRLVDDTPDGGTLIAGSGVGRPVVPDHMPKKIGLRDAHPSWKLLDFEKSGVGWRITTAAKDLIERLEPGVHQFFPVEVFAYSYDPTTWQDIYGNYDPVADGTHVDRKIADQWFFVICNRLDTMNRELTVGLLDNGNYGPGLLKLGIGGKPLEQPPRLVLNQSAIGQTHIWCERCVGHTFFSDRLIEEIDAAGLTGLRRTFIEAV